MDKKTEGKSVSNGILGLFLPQSWGLKSGVTYPEIRCWAG